MGDQLGDREQLDVSSAREALGERGAVKAAGDDIGLWVAAGEAKRDPEVLAVVAGADDEDRLAGRERVLTLELLPDAGVGEVLIDDLARVAVAKADLVGEAEAEPRGVRPRISNN